MTRQLIVRSCMLAAALMLGSAVGRCMDQVDYRTEADSLARYRDDFAAIAKTRQLSIADSQVAQQVLAAAEICYENLYALAQIKKLDACLTPETRTNMGQICYDYEHRTLSVLLEKKDSVDACLQRTTNEPLQSIGGLFSDYLGLVTDRIKHWIELRKF